MSQEIYCDESGFSGNNLLDPQQPFFAYASLALSSTDAEALVSEIRQAFRLEGDELKGQRLLRFNRGRKAIDHVIRAVSPNFEISVWDKKYSLATKFFEHVFEPVLAEKNSIYYNVGFHRFISTVVYLWAFTNESIAEKSLVVFQKLMRARDGSQVAELFPRDTVADGLTGVLSEIETFVACHQGRIAQEVDALRDDDPKFSWMLDLSISALFALLASHGEKHGSLQVFCDESKPLHAYADVFDQMVGRRDQARVTIEGRSHPILFSLEEPIRFVSSAAFPGVQLADLLASAALHAFRAPLDAQKRDWRARLLPSLSTATVLPDLAWVDLTTEQAFVNALILKELVDRSVRGKDLFDGMPTFIDTAGEVYHTQYLPSLSSPEGGDGV